MALFGYAACFGLSWIILSLAVAIVWATIGYIRSLEQERERWGG